MKWGHRGLWKTLKLEKSDVTYAKIKDKNEIQINSVEILRIIKKFFILILKIVLGTKSVKEKIADKHSEENPISDIIYSFFSIDCFFLILFLLMLAYNFHHVLHKPSMR